MEKQSDNVTLGNLIAESHSILVRQFDAKTLAKWILMIESVKKTYPHIWHCPLYKLSDLVPPISEEGDFLIRTLFPMLSIIETEVTIKRTIHELVEDEAEENLLTSIIKMLFLITYSIGYIDAQRGK